MSDLTKTNLICIIPKNVREQVRVEFMTYRSSDVLNLWVYYNSGNSVEEWRPSKKGLSISTDLLPDLTEGIEKAYLNWKGE